MANEKQILVIDAQFNLGRMLQEVLQREADTFQITSVPSGEEANFELLTRHFDLLITNLRLPGIDGPEVARWVYRRNPDMPVIIVSDDRLEKAKKALGDVAVFRILQKPFIQDEVLTAIRGAIYGEVEVAPPPAAVAHKVAALAKVRLSPEVKERLDILRSDTGALRLILGTMDGRIPFTTKGTLGLDINVLAPMIARNLRGSAELAAQMESDEPSSLHYQTSKRFETYVASVGPSFYIALFFDVRSRRSRFGMIWSALQRGVADVKNKLPYLDIEPIAATADVEPAARSAVTVETAVSAKPEPKPAPVKTKPQVKAKTQPKPEPEPEIEPAWTPPNMPTGLSGNQSMSFEEAMKQGFLGNLGQELGGDGDAEPAIDLFGDVADNDGDGDALFGAVAVAESTEPAQKLSFEDAMKQGLLGGDMASNPLFSAEEDADDSAAGLDLFGDVADDGGGEDLSDLLALGPVPDSSAPVADAGGMLFAEAMEQGLVGGSAAPADLFVANDDEIELDLGEADDGIEDDLAALEALATSSPAPKEEKPAKQNTDTKAEEEAFWNMLVSGNTEKSTVNGKSFEEAMQDGLAANDALSQAAEGGSGIDDDFLAALEGGDDDADLDALWSEESINDALSKTLPGISIDEARQKGILGKKK